MKLSVFVLCACLGLVNANAIVSCSERGVTYKGLSSEGVEQFLNIPYGYDISSQNRFKPAKPVEPPNGTIIDATKPGPDCPQALGQWLPPVTLENVTDIAEECLNLNVVRPSGTTSEQKLAVMAFIHGGSFWAGSVNEPTTNPNGLVLQSVENGRPVIVVEMNYRLGLFGFAQSGALKAEGSENAGLRDQRLALEWIQANIQLFGGDPNSVTIFGQSSGGLAVGMQILAYGGQKTQVFQRAICESQALEPGITKNFTIDAMTDLVNAVGCNSSSLDSPDTIECLRKLDMETLLNASIATHQSDIGHNIGDTWLPVVDGDFLPAAPSELINTGRFYNVTAMMGWADGDVNFFTPFDIATPNDTDNFVSAYLPSVSRANIEHLLSLYPSPDFSPAPEGNLTAEFYRSARIFRDIIMTCEPFFYGQRLAAAGLPVYFYDFNQTLLAPILAQAGIYDIGAIHTSEFAYVFGNLSVYNESGFPSTPTPSDYALRDRASRTWSNFATVGHPSDSDRTTLQGWTPAFENNGTVDVYVIGGPYEGLSSIDGVGPSTPQLRAEKLKERCAFINAPEMIEQIGF